MIIQILIIAVGVLVLGMIFYMGFYFGISYCRKKIATGEFEGMGADYVEKIQQLTTENRSHADRWQKIGSLINSFGTVREKDKLAQKMARTIVEEVMVKYGAILVRDNDVFKAMASEGIHMISQEMLEFSADDSLVKYMNNFPDAVSVKVNDRQFKPFRRLSERLEEVLLMPLRAGDDIVGLLWAGRGPGTGAFTDGQKSVMTFLGNTLGYLFQNRELVKEAEERALKIVTSLIKALEQKDEHTKGHSDHVSAYSEVFARYVGLDLHSVEVIHRAALLHDIGKIGIPERILSKPGKLTTEEFEIMKSHPVFGAELLKTLGFLKEELLLILHHHEKFNGTGYPYGLSEDKIPQGSVIISLADVFDALTSDQPFRKAYSIEQALEIMEKMGGEHFEPTILYHFLNFIRGRLKMQQKE